MSKARFLNTPKQREIMKILVEASSRGEVMTLHLLKSRLSYAAAVTNSAVLCSLAVLSKHGFVVKKLNGSKVMTILPTQTAFRRFKINEYPEPHL